jgi:hypothetical protein
MYNAFKNASHPTSVGSSCEEIKKEISLITDGEYAAAKQRVDELRQELGQPPLPALQTIMDERAAA